MSKRHSPQRREVVGLLGAASAAALAPAVQVAMATTVAAGLAAVARPAAAQAPAGTRNLYAGPAAIPTDIVTVMYRRETPQAPGRLEPWVQAAVRTLESEFIKRKLKVRQPSAEVYGMLEQGPAVVITFAPDAGYSLVFSGFGDVRPVPGQDGGIAEVRLSTKVFVGRSILVAEEGVGRVYTKLDAATRDFAVRTSLEVAARRAATDVAAKAHSMLEELTPDRLREIVGESQPQNTASVQEIRPGAPAGQPEPTAAPGAGGPATAPAPAPTAAAPAAAPATAAPVAPLPAPKNRHAVVIGMSNYAPVRAATGSNGIGDLPGVKRDVDLVLDALAKLGYPKQNVTALRDAAATSGAVRGAFKSLAGRAQAGDTVLVFIAGHGQDKDGSASGHGMPILADYKPDDANAPDYWELQSMLKNMPARVVWVNDTCHSGGAVKGMTSVVVSSRGVTAKSDVRGPDPASVAGGAGPGQDFAFLTACAPNELSLEIPTGGGIFTSALFTELVNSGGKVPVAKVFSDTVAQRVIAQSQQMCKQVNVCEGRRQQTPMMAVNGNGAGLTV
jgi:hypothetical protein